MSEVGQFIVIGLVTGTLYALIALGYTMVYGIIELINFAHGEVFMLGSFMALQSPALYAVLASWLGLPPLGPAGLIVLMLITAPVFCGLLNVLIDLTVYKPVRHAPKVSAVVSAIGVSFILMNVGLFWFGPVDLNFPNLVSNTDLLAGSGLNLRFTYKDLMVVAVTVPTMVALTSFVRYTTLGKAMRATAQNPTAARLMGIDVDRVIAATFAIGGALAGIGAVITGLYNTSAHYQMGFQYGLYAFTAAVLGGIGNIPGAVLGGLVIGVVGELSKAYLGTEWSEAVVFTILIVILLFRPAGLLGARIREKV